MVALPKSNQQVVTRWADESRQRLVTAVEETAMRALGPEEILVEVLGVGLHGSFWLATHPERLHPRWEEFLQSGRFVFGNGGVGRVVALGSDVDGVKVGDYVSVFGHVPCDEDDCVPCRQDHRYVECQYGKASIIGHGKGSADGTLANYAYLPNHSWGRCFKAEERPDATALKPYMYAFLAADVRNALTRYPGGMERKRILIVGAGLAGRLAASMLLQENPDCRVVAVDVMPGRASFVEQLSADRAKGIDALEGVTGASADAMGHAVERIRKACLDWFGGLPDMVMDCASEDASGLWATPRILSPGVLCLLFGFGMKSLTLDRRLLQLSGLVIQTSKGVGNKENRQAVLQLLKGGAADVLTRAIDEARRVASLAELEEMVSAYHNPPKPIHQAPLAYLDRFSEMEGQDE